MKKIVIPAILTATILVAGMFALMPVQKASTVHTTITGTLASSVEQAFTITDTDWDAVAAEDEIRLTCASGGALLELNLAIDGTLAGGDNINVVTDADGAGAIAAVTDADVFGVGAPVDAVNPGTVANTDPPEELLAGGTVSLTLTAEAADDGNERVAVTFRVSSPAACTVAQL